MRVFAGTGRFAVRFRWLVAAVWIVGAVLANGLLPSISSVTKGDNTSFLPASAPEQQAAALAEPFVPKNNATALMVASTSAGAVTSQQGAIDRVVAAVRTAPLVIGAHQSEVSSDGRAELVVVQINLPPYGGSNAGRLTSTIDGIRSAMAAGLRASGSPNGLSVHLTGPLAQAVDGASSSAHEEHITQLLSVLFILALLFVVFRAVLAPVITLLPAGIALLVAQPVIAELSRAGVSVSDLLILLLTVIVLGAGTDYGLFLIFRVREEIRRGRTYAESIEESVARVGEAISFSAFTVVAAMLSLLLAGFGLYRGLGPGLAIGIVLVLLANLTLLPALLAIFGRVVYWPSHPRPPEASEEMRVGLWGRVAARVVARPVLTLLAGLVVFGGLALAVLDYSPGGFNAPTVVANSDSSEGQSVLTSHFSTAETNPTALVFTYGGSLWENPPLLAVVQQNLEDSPLFASLAGPLDPNGSEALADLPEGPLLIEALYQQLGPPQDLGPTMPAGFSVTWSTIFNSLIDRNTFSPSPLPSAITSLSPSIVYEGYVATANFLTADGKTLLIDSSLKAGDPGSTRAINEVPAIRQAVEAAAAASGAQKWGVAGAAPALFDVAKLSSNDLTRIIPVIMLVLFALLVVVLRSLIAPLYLVVSVALSYLASLGFSVLIFVVIGGRGGLNFVLPFFMLVFIMALGEDYNILVMTRIREEVASAPLVTAVRKAVEATGTTVTSAGLILAGTFTVLTAGSGSQVREVGLGLAIGVLLDTFLVRTLLVPSMAVLVGRWNWWPSPLYRKAP